MTFNLPAVVELGRLPSPTPTPQALAWHRGTLWISSRDERRLCGVDPQTWTVIEETATPGIPWAAVPVDGAIYFTMGEDPDDDRYLRGFEPGRGFDESYRVAQPEFTGSYLSFDGQSLYLSQWYKHRLLELDRENGRVLRTVEIGAEICGHVFVAGHLYVLRGTEQDGESWHLARLDLHEASPRVEALAQVPFACRSLAFDGNRFWTNHRAENQTVSFALSPL
jgi:outer membrane protein assembly factor BamB